MRPLVVGLGSMGKRRIRNLRALRIEEILGVDARADRRQEAEAKYGIRTFATFEEAMPSEPDVAIISLPPDLHMPFALRVLKAGLPFFVEVNVLTAGVREVLEEMDRRNLVGVASSTMRFWKGPRRLKELLGAGRIGEPQAWIYHSGMYLPDWHPWESIQDFYVSRKDTAACREIIVFELSWLVDLLGPVSALSCMKAKVSSIAADIDDVYQLQLRQGARTLGHLTVDVVARSPVRHLRLLGSEGSLEWNNAAQTLAVYDARAKAWTQENLAPGTVEPGYVHPEDPYVDEMAHVLRCVRGEEAPAYGLRDDLRILELLEKAEESHAAGRRIDLDRG